MDDIHAAARAEARARLLGHIDLHDSLQGEMQGGPGGYSEEAFAELGRLVDALKPFTPIPAPMDALQHVEGRWETLFAHFGARHSAFKAKVHESNLKIQSFNLLPPTPVRIERICQEISCSGAAYNNVIDFVAMDGHTRGLIIMHGRYREESDNRQRFAVDFHRIELRPAPGVSELQLRVALELPAVTPLIHELTPPRLHSDVVYLDADLRINVGSFGGLYVLRRSADGAATL